MQGVNLSYVRLKFFEESGFTLDHKMFNLLLIDDKHFTKRFGYSNEELKKKYLR